MRIRKSVCDRTTERELEVLVMAPAYAQVTRRAGTPPSTMHCSFRPRPTPCYLVVF